MTPALSWLWLGRVPHADAMARQEARRTRLLGGELDAAAVLLAEHEPTITLGRSADDSHVLLSPAELAARGIQVLRTTRGGQVTYHGPGQLMVYPVVRLRGGLVAYLECVSRALAQVAAEFHVPGAAWKRDPAGLWVGDRKLASCGVHVSRRVTTHGFAFDVATPDAAWTAINPCGLPSVPNTSLAAERARRGIEGTPSVREVAEIAGPMVCRHLDTLLRGALPSTRREARSIRS